MINNTLIALMNSQADFEIAMKECWYRIPVDTRIVPQIVRDNKVQLIAFYHTAAFGKEKFSVQYFAPIEKITIVKRKQLLLPPDIPLERLKYDLKAENDYFKIEFSPLHKLPTPIISKKHRRILFIPTTDKKLFTAKEINFLFNDSPLEEVLWEKFVEYDIPAERQYFLEIQKNPFLLDFAIFCQTRNINIECDGDQHHTSKADVHSDKKRNNLLESRGWSVLRFTPDDIYSGIDPSLALVKETINKYGGVKEDDYLTEFRYLQNDDDPQLKLFEPDN